MEKTVNINDLSVVELKSLAYDLIADSERIKANLNQVNNMIIKKMEDQQKEQVTTEE